MSDENTAHDRQFKSLVDRGLNGKGEPILPEPNFYTSKCCNMNGEKDLAFWKGFLEKLDDFKNGSQFFLYSRNIQVRLSEISYFSRFVQ